MAEEKAEEKVEEKAEGNKENVLIVEDDITLRDMYAERLRAEGFVVDVAGDGEEGLAHLARHKPDVMLLDLMMPKVNGFNVLDIMKTTPEYKGIPVIILTALIQDENKLRGLTSGASDYIVKSETMPGEVIAKIRAVLQKSKNKK